GKVFTVAFSPDTPLTFAAGGSQGVLRIFDPLSNPGVRKTFHDRLAKHVDAAKMAAVAKKEGRTDGLVKLVDEDWSEDDEDDEPASEEARAALAKAQAEVAAMEAKAEVAAMEE
ncbi:hypothetical protein CF319_g4046, partial [Tilletia indica]